MKLKIDHQEHTFVPIQTFRDTWDLPDNFTVAYFEPKNWAVGSIDGSGKLLAVVKDRVIEAVESRTSWNELPLTVEKLALIFRIELESANRAIGLREAEIDFAVAGFSDVLNAAAYDLIRLSQKFSHIPAEICEGFNFATIYQAWLNETVRVSSVAHEYQHENLRLKVQVIYNAYGRIGMKVQTADEVYYVVDTALACPAAGYMYDLCSTVARELCAAVEAAIV